MRSFCSCLGFRSKVVSFAMLMICMFFFHHTVHALTASIGRPYQGRLVNGIPFPSQFRGYQLREEERTYTTPEVIGALLDAFEGVRTQFPNTCDLYLGDFSNVSGSGMSRHRSHQNGRDVDLGMYAKGNRTLTTFHVMNEENLDVAKTWCLVEGILRSQRVQYIFLDRRVQKLLYDYASSQGVDQCYLDRLFANARGSIMQHVVNHQDHIHVRFFTPWSTLAAHVGESEEQKRTVIEMAQQSYLPKKVQYYAKGNDRGIDALAKSFGVTAKDLCRWNNLRNNEVLPPGSCVVFYKRGFEIEPVHLAQSLQAPSISEPATVQLASYRPPRTTLSDAPAGAQDTDNREKKPESAAPPTAYTARRGDTLDKIAKQHGLDAKALSDLNGIKKNGSLKAGQKIKLTGVKNATEVSAAPTVSEAPKLNTAKPVHAQVQSTPEHKKAKPAPPLPITYTAAKGDTLDKIARQKGLTVEELCSLNGLKKTATLQPGQKFIVGHASSKASSVQSSAKTQTKDKMQLAKANVAPPAPQA